jgi:hypothetical protein
VTTPGSYGHGRTWRAVLDPVPIRFRHLTSFDGLGELDVLSGLLRRVELYDGQAVQSRHGESDLED